MVQNLLFGAPPLPDGQPTLVWPIQPPGGGWAESWGCFENSEAGALLFQRLQQRLAEGAVVYPPDPLRALRLTDLAQVRVVILGQDPYHGPGQANGLAFSVAPGVRVPPSLRNVFKELQQDLGLPVPKDGSLDRWAKQGVLLLNTCLTVEDGAAASHAQWGWEIYTDALIRLCSEHGQAKVFLLWGGHAQQKTTLIHPRHHVLRANHPSPLSAVRGPLPFIGCGHFSLANEWLQRAGSLPVEW